MHLVLRVPHLDDATLHMSDDDTSVFLIKSSDALIKTKDKNSSFYVPLFYKYVNDLPGNGGVRTTTSLYLRSNYLKSLCRVEYACLR